MAIVALEDVARKARDLFDKGFAAMERGNLDYAMDMFLSALDIEPQFLQARKFLRAAQMKKLKGKKGSPLTHLISSLRGLPGFLSAKSAVGKKPEKALKAAENLLRLDPLNLTFIKLYREAAVAAGLSEAALLTMEVAREYYPKDTTLLRQLGELYSESENTQKARECFEEYARLRPKDPAAIKALKDAAALDTMRSGGWTGGGTYRDIMKDTKEAALLEQQAKAVKASTSVEALIQDTLEKAEREPENVNYKRALADLYMRSERFEEALAVLGEAQKATGGADPEVDRSISVIRTRQFDHKIAELKAAGQAAEAEASEQAKQKFLLQDARDRVQRYPNDLGFKYDLGILLYERRDLNEAIQLFQQAQRNPQRRTRALYYLALCFKAKEQYDIAIEQLQKAASELQIMDDTKKDILYELGELSEAVGDPGKAAEYYKEIYAVDIGYRDISEKIEKTYKK